MLDDDVLVIVDPVLDGVKQPIGHGPPRSSIEPDGGEVLDPSVQFEFDMPSCVHRRFGCGQHVRAQAAALVLGFDEQMHQLMTQDREVANGNGVDDDDLSLEARLWSEPLL